jgi:hypothetical protein
MFKLEFETGNAAFTDNLREECARILRKIADQLESGRECGRCMDYNGNAVGDWELTEDE